MVHAKDEGRDAVIGVTRSFSFDILLVVLAVVFVGAVPGDVEDPPAAAEINSIPFMVGGVVICAAGKSALGCSDNVKAWDTGVGVHDPGQSCVAGADGLFIFKYPVRIGGIPLDITSAGGIEGSVVVLNVLAEPVVDRLDLLGSGLTIFNDSFGLRLDLLPIGQILCVVGRPFCLWRIVFVQRFTEGFFVLSCRRVEKVLTGAFFNAEL